MKLAFRQIEPFVKQPDVKARVILIYGPEPGLMKERSAIIGRTIVADLNDPFNAVTLSAEALIADPARLMDEAAAMSMMGGARLIRIEDARRYAFPSPQRLFAKPQHAKSGGCRSR
jgi:DNA polymerase-3 subunit delta